MLHNFSCRLGFILGLRKYQKTEPVENHLPPSLLPSFTLFRRIDTVLHTSPLGCISKFMRYACLHHLEGLSIKLLLSRVIHLGKSLKDWAGRFTATPALYSPLYMYTVNTERALCSQTFVIQINRFHSSREVSVIITARIRMND